MEDKNTTETLRPVLGDFSSIVCFRALVVGVEETLGKRAAMVALRSAGRKRGSSLVQSLGLSGKGPTEGAEGAAILTQALGPEGTRLCIVNDLKILEDGEVYEVYLSDTICSADEPQGSDRELSFTYGAIHGAIEEFYDIKLRGKQVGSILRGQDYDIVRFVKR